MKPIKLFIYSVTLLILFSCYPYSDNMLIGKWQVEKVFMNGKFIPNEFFEGVTFEYKTNNELIIDPKPFAPEYLSWTLNDSSTISLKQKAGNQEERYIHIVELTDSSFVWEDKTEVGIYYAVKVK